MDLPKNLCSDFFTENAVAPQATMKIPHVKLDLNIVVGSYVNRRSRSIKSLFLFVRAIDFFLFVFLSLDQM